MLDGVVAVGIAVAIAVGIVAGIEDAPDTVVVDLVCDGGLAALVDEGGVDRLLVGHGGRGEVRGGALVVLGGRGEALVLCLVRLVRLVLLLSIGEGKPGQEDQSEGQEVLGALGSDMARWPSQHLGDHNADVRGGRVRRRKRGVLVLLLFARGGLCRVWRRGWAIAAVGGRCPDSAGSSERGRARRSASAVRQTRRLQ